jgi:hypothetical protein
MAAAEASALRPGDLVLSTQPEQVPVLHRYLPSGLSYRTPLGPVRDPGQMDWRDALARLGRPRPALARLEPGQRVLLVTPTRYRGHSPWSDLVRLRTRQWRAQLSGLRVLRPETAIPSGAVRGAVRAELFQVP